MTEPVRSSHEFARRQKRELRRITDRKFVEGDFEYRLTYRTGFAPTIRIERRRVGKRAFAWYDLFDARNLLSADAAEAAIRKFVREKEERNASGDLF